MARFTTADGRFVGWRRLPAGLLAFGQAILRKTTGRIPRQPWIPFGACRALEALVQPSWRVWEVGAGFSTLWLSDRVAHLTSIEASRTWFDRLGGIILGEGIRNVDLRFEWVSDRMADFATAPDGSLDLLFIDGGSRELCLRRGFAKVKPGGYCYLDNWDVKCFWGEADSFLAQNSDQIDFRQSFVDYVPAQFGVYEGLLLRKRSDLARRPG